MNKDTAAVILAAVLLVLVIAGALILPSLFSLPSPPGSLAGHPLFDKAAKEAAPDDVEQNDTLSRRGASAGQYVLIEEFSDFQCPYCGDEAATVERVRKAYAGQVRVVYKHFPLQQLHPNAVLAAEASECARDQRKFWAYHDLLFDHQQRLEKESLLEYAGTLHLNMTRFAECLDTGQKKGIVGRDLADGIARGVRGTPTFFVDGELVMGAVPFSEFSSMIDQKLLRKQHEQQETSSS